MSKTKHTPGPWKFITMEFGELVNGVGKVWTECAIEFGEGGPGTIIAECFGRSDENTFHDAVANARLIAAAPEMLEALQVAQAELEQCEPPDEYPEQQASYAQIMAQIKSAIAKATGGES